MNHSQNKIALITGASSPRDIGIAICRKLASQGIDIFFTHWKSDITWIEKFQQEIVNMVHYAVNMRSTFLLSVEFARLFEKSTLETGRIINMTSGQELGPMPGELAYAATKGAISAFTRSLSAELAPLGITVNAVNPGPTDSTWMTDEIREHLLPKFPMGRIGLPEDVARLIAFLASDDANWITGQIIHSEGGFIRS
ncbi:SDR family oxidoreductase [Bacillus litorisediminis]|uniref:SDR family oxidoreductase n=1 Tax=Bacillus litorisediminis TaxID=2922713 RepID=UPI001FAC23CE|nr:SDR family oxidoreductase [Bacillus litorisediminis]